MNQQMVQSNPSKKNEDFFQRKQLFNTKLLQNLLKSLTFVAIVSVFLLSLEAAEELKLDPGGVSIDFSKKHTFPKNRVSGKNLIRNGTFAKLSRNGKIHLWAQSANFWGSKTSSKGFAEALKNRTRVEAKREGKTTMLSLFVDAKMWDIVDKNPKLTYGAYALQHVVLNSTESKKYSLSFRYRGKNPNPLPQSGLRWGASFPQGVVGKYSRRAMSGVLAPTQDWQKVSVSFVVPPKTKTIFLSFSAQRSGSYDVTDVEIYEEEMTKAPEIKLIPLSFLDNQFFFSSGGSGILHFAFRNPANTQLKRIITVVELPAQLHFLSTEPSIKLLEKKKIKKNSADYIQYKFDVTAKFMVKGYHGVRSNGFFPPAGMQCLFRCDLPTGDKEYPSFYYLEYDRGGRTSRCEFTVKVIPEIKGATPKKFVSGPMFSGYFDNMQGVTEFADFYKKVGMNMYYMAMPTNIYSKKDKESAENAFKIMGKKGLARYVQNSWLQNGYMLGYPSKYGSKYSFQRRVVKNRYGGTCPFAIYSKGKFFQKDIYPRMKRIIVDERIADNFMPNWEPHIYYSNGCFCTNCKAEFIKFSKLPAAEVNKIWGQNIMFENAKYEEIWSKFRSWQNAQILILLEETTQKLGKMVGIDSHFIPVIRASDVHPGWEKGRGKYRDCRQFAPIDYVKKMPVIEPWGPYYYHRFSLPYSRVIGAHLGLWVAAKSVRKWMDQNGLPNGRSQIISFPHAYQSADWVTEPEAIAFETLCFFLQRWNGAAYYGFPKGYDARYWNALAKSNTTISLYEKFVLKGKSRKGTVKAASPMPVCAGHLPTSEIHFVMGDLPKIQGEGLLRSKAFELNGKYLIAVGNFWQGGEVFFRLNPGKLPAGRKYVLHESEFKRVYARKGGKIELTSDDLQRNMLLHVGALRFAFFIIEEYRPGQDYGKVILPKDMNAAFKQRLPAIRRQYNKDQTAIETSQVKYKRFEPVSNGKLKVIARTGSSNNDFLIEVDAPEQKILIAPGSGGRIISYKIKGEEMVQKSTAFAVAVDGVIFPRSAITSVTEPYHLKSIKKQGEKIVIRMEKILTPQSKVLAGLRLSKKLTINPGLGGVMVSSTVFNPSESVRKFIFRYHNVFKILADKSADMSFIENSTPKKIISPKVLSLFMLKPESGAKQLQEAFQFKAFHKLSKPYINLSRNDSPIALEINFPGKNNCSLLSWGSVGCPSIELLSDLILLSQGDSFTFNMHLKPAI